MSRAHGSRAWELRTATDLAALWADQGRSDDARALLLPDSIALANQADALVWQEVHSVTNYQRPDIWAVKSGLGI